MRKLLLPALLVPLLSLTACWNSAEPVAPVESVPAPVVGQPLSTEVPSIDEQIDDVSGNRGDISDEDREKLNGVPVVPDVFDK